MLDLVDTQTVVAADMGMANVVGCSMESRALVLGKQLVTCEA